MTDKTLALFTTIVLQINHAGTVIYCQHSRTSYSKLQQSTIVHSQVLTMRGITATEVKFPCLLCFTHSDSKCTKLKKCISWDIEGTYRISSREWHWTRPRTKSCPPAAVHSKHCERLDWTRTHSVTNVKHHFNIRFGTDFWFWCLKWLCDWIRWSVFARVRFNIWNILSFEV